MATNISNPAVIEALRKGMGFNPFFTESKKLQPSFCWMGKKNAGKTWKLLDTFRGPMLILSFDNQTEIIVKEKINREKKKFGKSFIEENVIVANFTPSEYGYIKGSGDERRLDVGYAIIKDVEKMLDNIRSHNIHFDYIVLDGYPELKDRINEYMRKSEGLTLTEKILLPDLTAYGYRNRFYQLLVYSMFELSDICPVYTTYPKVDLSKVFKGNPPPESEMDKNFITLFRNTIWLERTIEEDRKKKSVIKFYANLQAMKGLDFGEEGTVIDVTGDTPVFPIEKLESYRKGNPMNPVQVPEIKAVNIGIDSGDLDLDFLDDKANKEEQPEDTEEKRHDTTKKDAQSENTTAVSEEKDTQSQPQPSGSSFLDDL